MRLTGTFRVAVLALTLPLGLVPLATRAQDASVPEQTVQALQRAFGVHPGHRTNHAKGVVFEGRFAPTEAGARLSRAALLRGGPVPVIGRFSDATGLSDIADGAAAAKPNGLALRLGAEGAEQWDLVLNTLPFFPVATGEGFLELLRAAAASPPDAPKPTALDRFGEAHPAAPRAAAAVRTPASLAEARFNGLNAFFLVDEQGRRQPFRLRVLPVAGERWLTPEEAARQPRDFLMQGIAARLARGPAEFRLAAQLARPGDQTRDATQPWPEDRELVELGTLTVTRIAPEGERIAREVVFMPNNLPNGIEASDDALIEARVQAYAVSFGLRSR